MKKIWFLVLLLPFSACAEIRVWEDKAGRRFEAEFISDLFDKITLRGRDGTEVRFAADELSEHDQRYLRVMVPPQIEIDCGVSTEFTPPPWDLWHSDNATLTRIKGKVTVQKISKRPFTSRLTAELYLVAKEVDGKNFILLSRTPSKFLLLENNENRHIFQSEPFVTRIYTEYNHIQRRGEEYLGYLVVVSDAQGNIVKTKTDIGEWIQQPEVIKNLRELAIRGTPSLRSRHFDKTGRKAEVPRPKFYIPDNP